jgi:hypothetical protein
LLSSGANSLLEHSWHGDIDSCSDHLLDDAPNSGEIEQGCLRTEVDEQIDVARRIILASRDRPEDARIGRPLPPQGVEQRASPTTEDARARANRRPNGGGRRSSGGNAFESQLQTARAKDPLERQKMRNGLSTLVAHDRGLGGSGSFCQARLREPGLSARVSDEVARFDAG